MELPEHVADHGRGLCALGARARAVVPHGVQDAALHRLLAVAHARQRAILHGGDGVLQVLRRGIAAQRQRIAVLARHRREVRRQPVAVSTAGSGRRRLRFHRLLRLLATAVSPFRRTVALIVHHVSIARSRP